MLKPYGISLPRRTISSSLPTFFSSFRGGCFTLHWADGKSWQLKAPWARKYFSERNGLKVPTLSLWGFRVFRETPLTVPFSRLGKTKRGDNTDLTELLKRATYSARGTPYPAPGQPCAHTGCLRHISHPCEGCGRIGGQPITSAESEDEVSK